MASIGDGKDRVIATAQRILKSLRSNNDSNTEEMLRVFFNFDDRFSAMNDKHQTENDSSEVPATENHKVVESLKIAGETVIKWEMTSSEFASKTQIWSCRAEESDSYLQAVDELQDLMGSLSVSRKEREVFDRVQRLLQMAMTRLEEEFRHLLITHSSSVDPEWVLEVVGAQSGAPDDETEEFDCKGENRDGVILDECNTCEDTDDDIRVGPSLHAVNFAVELLHPDVISDLNDIARRMISGGYGRECCQIYSGIRKAFLDQCLHRLGVEKLSMEDVHKMAWENLELRIKKWVNTLRIAIKVFYANERILCEQVFAGLSPWRDAAFADLAKGSMLQILSLGEGIAISRRSPEKLFKILDMYEALWELTPDINFIFSDELCSNVRSEAHGILIRLGEAARGTFAEFENAIQRDASRTPVSGGAVHPLTRYVMNYIWLLFSYSCTLRRLLGDKKLPPSGSKSSVLLAASGEEDAGGGGTDHLSPLAVQIVWLTVLLECNLDGKSKLYKDVAQSYFFLMNNAHYIVQKVKQSDLSSLVGEDWVRKHLGMVRQYATNYVRASWMRVLACLREEGISSSGSFSSTISKGALKERFKAFNSYFEEVIRTQSAWLVPDPQLREELRLSIAEKLIPAYRTFCSRYQGYLDSGKHPGKHVKYMAEDLESCLLDLFEGTSCSTVAKRKSFSIG